MTGQLWTMKILSGVHVGAEVTLDAEEAVIGSGEDCDFVLEDRGLAGRHISLLPTGPGVRLTVLDAGNTVYVDGQRIDGSVLLDPFQVVSMGGLSLAVGPAGQPWPKVDLPSIQADAGDAPKPDAAAADADAPGEEAALEGEPTMARGEDADEAAARPHRRMPAAAAAAAAVLAIAGAAWLLTPDEPEPRHRDPAQAAREIREIAQRYGADIQVGFERDPDAPVTVTGSVVSDRDLRSLLDELAATGVRAAVHIVSSEQLSAYANAILEQALNRDGRNRVEALPVPHAPGELAIVGYVERESSLSAARALLAQDLKGANGLTYRIQTAADRLAVLRRRLDRLGLGDRLLIQRLDDGVGLFGPVRSGEELARIRGLVEDFNAEFDSRPLLRLDGTDSFLGVSTVDFDVRAVVLGERIHVIAQDGASYAEGSKIPGGYVVRTITERYMILEKPVEISQAEEAESPGLAYVIFDGA